MSRRLSIAFVCFVIGLAPAAPAARVHLKGGTILGGEIEARDAAGVVLRLSSGERLFLAAADVDAVDDGVATPTATFTRFVDRKKDGASLETLNTTYFDSATGVRVTLVSAVHVADPEYYHALQGVLEANDRILFEGVGRDGASAKEDADLEFIDKVQRELQDLLKLTFQRDGIRYGGPKWRNADLSWPEVQKELKEKNLELFPNFGLVKALSPLVLKLVQFEKLLIEKSGEEEVLRARIKRMMGGFLARSDEIFQMLSAGKEKWRDDVLIGSRNAAAVAVLKDELSHKAGRSFAIFYGAAHMKDMERRLVEELHLVKVAEGWMTAWCIR